MMEVDMAKEEEEFDKMFHSTACEFDEDVEFARVYNMTAFEFNENEGAREFDNVFYTDTVEQDSGYQEVLCPLLRGGCSQDDFKTFTQKWSLYAECRVEIDDRELRQELLNCAVGPLEDMMYDTLGAKVDSLSEADLLIYNEGYENKTYTKKVDMPKTIADTSYGHADPQRAMPYFMEDGSTPDWSENFSSLKLSKVVVPSVSNITELNLSNSQMQTEDITKVLTDKTLADQCRLMTAIADTSMDSAATKLCYRCGEVVHADKMLADQCRLMTAILGRAGGGRAASR
jgi:hypothetical protein